MNRKAQDLGGTLVKIVVFGVVFISLILLSKEFLTAGKNSFTEKQCQTSLLLTKAVSPNAACFVGTPDVIPLQCGRNFISVDRSKAMVNGKEVTKLYDASCPPNERFKSEDLGYGSGGAPTQDEIKERAKTAPSSLKKPQPGDDPKNICLAENVVAQEMSRCWKSFFNGEQIVLQQMDISALEVFTRKDALFACYICGEVTIKGTPSSDMAAYLKNKAMPDGKVSYYDYLANNSKAWCDPALTNKYGSCWDGIQQNTDKDHLPFPLAKLDADKKYAVVFIRRGLGSCDRYKNDQTTFGNQYLTNTVQLVPVDILPKICDKVAG